LRLGQRTRLHVVCRVRKRLLQHPRDLVVAKAIRRLDDDRRLDAGRLLARGDRQQAVGIDLEGHADSRGAGDQRRNVAQLESRERTAVGNLLPLALDDVDRHRRLAVLERRELLRAGYGDRRIARHDLLDEAPHRLDPQRERNHIEQQPVIVPVAVAGERVRLHGRAQRDDFVRIEVRQRRLAEQFGNRAADFPHPCRAAHEHDTIDVRRRQRRVAQRAAHRRERLLDQVARDRRERLGGQRQVDRQTAGQRGDDRRRVVPGQHFLRFSRLDQQQPRIRRATAAAAWPLR
jgi:hypothetical protein